MGPRPRGRGIKVALNYKRQDVWLQWGHDRAVVEFWLEPWKLGDTEGLQWGHDRAVVELRRLAEKWKGTEFSFNGATTARSWNYYSPSGIEFMYARLQWGHDRAVVEFSGYRLRAVASASFNGATTARSWNCYPGGLGSGLHNCFNGATTARSWNCPNGCEPWRAIRSFNGATTARSWNYRWS